MPKKKKKVKKKRRGLSIVDPDDDLDQERGKPEELISQLRDVCKKHGYDIDATQCTRVGVALVVSPDTTDLEEKEIRKALQFGG